MGWWKGEVGMGDIRLVERIWRWRPKEGIQVPIGSHLLVPRPNTNHKELRRAAVKLPLLSVHPEITRDVKVIVNIDDKAPRGASAETAASSRGGGGERRPGDAGGEITAESGTIGALPCGRVTWMSTATGRLAPGPRPEKADPAQ